MNNKEKKASIPPKFFLEFIMQILTLSGMKALLCNEGRRLKLFQSNFACCNYFR